MGLLKVLDGINLIKIIRIKKTIVGEDECGHTAFKNPISITGGANINIVCTVGNISGNAEGCVNAGINGYFL